MKNENNKIILDYMDDGIGISKEKAKHSVEPFFKGKMSARGAGIGLSLIHVLFDGEMSVESDSGKGFRVTMII